MHLPQYIPNALPASLEGLTEEQIRKLREQLALAPQPLQDAAVTGGQDEGKAALPTYAPPPDANPQRVTELTRQAVTRPRLSDEPPPNYSTGGYVSGGPGYQPGLPAPATTEAPPAATTAAPTVVTGPRVTYETKKGQQVPTGVEGEGTELEKQEAYLRARRAYQPHDHNGRFKSALKGAYRQFIHGGSPIAGALQGAVEPESDERYENEREIARTSRAVKGEYDRRKAQYDVNKPYYRPDVIKTAEGPVYGSGPGAPAVPIYDPQGKRVGPEPARPGSEKTEVRFNSETGKAEKWVVGTGGQPDKKVDGWTDIKQDLVKTRSGRWVPQSTAEMADATSSERDYRHGRDATQDQRHESERTEDKATAAMGKQEERNQRAGKVHGDFNAARERWMSADAQVSQLTTQLQAATDPEKKQELQDKLDGWNFERTKAQKEAAAAAGELSTSFGDMFEAGIADKDENGVPNPGRLPYAKWRPFSKSQLKKNMPGISKAAIDAAVKAARDRGQPVID